MDNDEIKAALKEGVPIVAGGVEYAKISALICRNHNGKIILQAELIDKNGNSVTIAQPKKITRAMPISEKDASTDLTYYRQCPY